MQVSRRQFFKICAGGMAGTTAAALGFAPSVALAETRQYKLLRTRETRNTCTYCSVGCGLLMYSLGDGAKNAKASIFHIEGDPDHPVNRGALCPKGAGLVDFIHSESRLKFPEYRAPGSDKWQQISWEEAFDRIAKLMKEDRDANYIAQNAEGVTVNRWLSHRDAVCFRVEQRNRLFNAKILPRAGYARGRQPGACLTRTNGSKSCSNIWSRCDDQPLGRHQERQPRRGDGR